MQTLISVFDDRTTARRAIERLVEAGFARTDLHLQEPAVDEASAAADRATGAQERAVGSMTMHTAEREVAVDRNVLESIGAFFTSLMGKDHRRHAGPYTEALRRGSAVVVVDARDDMQAETAATMLHDLGAVDVNERAAQWRDDGWDTDADLTDRDPMRPGVRTYERGNDASLRDIVAARRAQTEMSPETKRYANPEPKPETLEDRAGRVATERAMAFGDGPRNEPRDADGKPSR